MGKPLSEETKKKISEALKKNGGAETPPPSSNSQQSATTEMKGLEDSFNSSQKNIDGMKQSLKSITDKYASIKGRGSKGTKAKLRAQAKEIRAKLKVEREKQAKIKEQAIALKIKQRAAQNIQKATIRLQKVQISLKKLDSIGTKASSMLAKAKTPEQKQRVADMLARAAEQKTNQTKAIEDTNAFIKSQQAIASGAAKPKVRNIFQLQEPKYHVCFLSEKKFTPWRTLKEVEKKTDFEFLDGSFNSLETQMGKDLNTAIDEDTQANVKKVDGKIKSGDIAAIAAMTFLSFNKLYSIIVDYYKRAFEVGKKTGSDEMGVERPNTPTQKTQLMNFGASQIAQDFVNEVNSEAKETARLGLAKGATAVAIVATINDVVKKKSKQFVKEATGGVVSDGVNEGRRLVFEKNVAEIQGYLRSEILDDRTCPICLSMDGTQVKPNDPMAQLDQVHDNCRGVWIPIKNDEDVEDDWGVPSQVENAFDMENRFGLPYKNNFKQLKSPIN